MKNLNWIYFSIVIVLAGMLSSCSKEKEVPEILTDEVKDVTDVTTLCGGKLTSDGGSKIMTCGVCWSIDSTNLNIEKAEHTLDSVKNGFFTSTITNLTPDTKYYIKAYATNKIGTGYGRILSFVTTIYNNNIIFNPSIDYGNLIDQDGNSYKTVSIGSQVWMGENLKAITYNDGTPLSLGSGILGPEYYWYDNNPNLNKSTFGALYPPWVVNSGKLCPIGWHIPSNIEWSVLINFLGGELDAGGKLKETGTAHWHEPNEGATNETGFTALPAGTVDLYLKNFYNQGIWGTWWSSYFVKAVWAGSRLITYCTLFLKEKGKLAFLSYVDTGRNYYSVRCVKD
jgi:uncharacterized protein (TIGR02145 family)